jgi:DNA-binding Lrp family transcriptional regulator
MDELDGRILKALQDEFPLDDMPYDILARNLQITTDELWERIQQMIKDGLIRRIGVSLDSKKIGFSSTLAAVSVPSNQVEKASEIIAGFPEVTHSYLRRDEFNIWFTIIALDNKRIDNILKQIQSQLSLKDSQVLNLPAKRFFKLDARFSLPS